MSKDKIGRDDPLYGISAWAASVPADTSEFGLTKICEMTGVIERTEGVPVELWREDSTGKLYARSYNEGGNNICDLDLSALFRWVRGGIEDHPLAIGNDLPGLAHSTRTNLR